MTDLAERVAGVAALADPMRLDLYRYVIAQPTPVSRDQAATGLGVPRHTAKFHLDKLVEAGLLDRGFQRLSGRRGPGAGRPAKLYQRSKVQVSVTLPERHYDLAAGLLAQAVDDSVRTSTPVLACLAAAAADRGGQLAHQAAVVPGSTTDTPDRVTVACDVLAEQGYEPRRSGSRVTLANCPFDALARAHTNLVCGMNLALLEAFTRQAAAGAMRARLDPDADRCCVVLDVAEDRTTTDRADRGLTTSDDGREVP